MMALSRAKWMAAGVALSAAFVVLTGFGRPFGHSMGGPLDEQKVRKFATYRLDAALDDLDASPDQRQKLQALKDRALTDGFAKVGSHRTVRGEVLRQWEAANPDRAKVHQLIDQDLDTLRAFAHARADDLLEAHDVLTPAQRTKVGERFAGHAGDWK